MKDKITTFDLNLLTVLGAIFRHKSVSGAAKALSVTPSAVSQSLQKLRDHFNDILFVRDGKVLQPTTVCLKIHKQLSDNLLPLVAMLDRHSSIRSKKSFVIYASEFFALTYLPRLIGQLEYMSPEIDITCRTIPSGISASELLLGRQADIVFDLKPSQEYAIQSKQFTTEFASLICSQNNPWIDEQLTREHTKKQKFVCYASVHQEIIQRQVELFDFLGTRNIAFTCDSFALLLDVIERTSLIGIVPYSLLKASNRKNIKTLSCDFVIEPVKTFILYNKHARGTPGFSELLEMLFKSTAL